MNLPARTKILTLMRNPTIVKYGDTGKRATACFSHLQKAPRLQTTQQVDRCKNHRHRVSSHVQSTFKGGKHMAQANCALSIVIFKTKELKVNNQHKQHSAVTNVLAEPRSHSRI